MPRLVFLPIRARPIWALAALFWMRARPEVGLLTRKTGLAAILARPLCVCRLVLGRAGRGVVEVFARNSFHQKKLPATCAGWISSGSGAVILARPLMFWTV